MEVAQLAAERDTSLEARRRMQHDLDAATRELAEARRRIVEIAAERAEMAGRYERLTQVEQELAAAREQARHWNEACQRAEQRLTETATRLQEQMRAAEERQAMLERVGAEFSEKFKALSNELLDQHGRKFAEQSQANLGTLLHPLREQLGEFRKRVDEVYDKESRERALLKHEIDSLKTLNQKISEEAINLTRALKGDTRAQGAWGEMVLERVLEASGLQEGREYETQVALKDEDGGRPRPDVIVHLPDNKDIIIDAKVSLTAYERFVAAVDDTARAAALAEHVASVRRHIDALGARSYSEIVGVKTIDFVLMFVPIEPAFIEAVRADGELYGYALRKNISLVSPSTLLATLRTVAHLWRIERRNLNAMEMARRAAQLHDNFALLVEELIALGEQLDKAQKAQASALRRLTEGGKGSVILQVQSLAELDAPVRKSLPRALLAAAGANDEAETVPGGDAAPAGD